jgi:hypothetical protein
LERSQRAGHVRGHDLCIGIDKTNIAARARARVSHRGDVTIVYRQDAKRLRHIPAVASVGSVINHDDFKDCPAASAAIRRFER